jgi:hypothetical protein
MGYYDNWSPYGDYAQMKGGSATPSAPNPQVDSWLDTPTRRIPRNSLEKLRQNQANKYIDRAVGTNYDPWSNESLSNPYKFMSNPLNTGGYNYANYMDEGGDKNLYGALAQQGAMNANARTRASMMGLRARMGNNPSAYGLAALQSSMQGQSDLANTMANARVQSINQNRQFREGMLNRAMNLQDERRSMWQKQIEREAVNAMDLDAYKRKSDIDKKNRPRRRVLGIF